LIEVQKERGGERERVVHKRKENEGKDGPLLDICPKSQATRAVCASRAKRRTQLSGPSPHKFLNRTNVVTSIQTRLAVVEETY